MAASRIAPTPDSVRAVPVQMRQHVPIRLLPACLADGSHVIWYLIESNASVYLWQVLHNGPEVEHRPAARTSGTIWPFDTSTPLLLADSLRPVSHAFSH